ncbi:Jacalin-related lectin 3 [Zea mays]|nr:Jacalin-related lectin 3 [Zea mays]
MAPNLLENDMDLHFDLLSLHFIELVRSKKFTEALDFGQKKLTSFQKVTKYIEKLEDFMALLAYEEPEKSPMFHLLSPEHRQNVAEGLNRAVLAHANLPAYSSLERVVQQATVVRQYLQQEVGKDSYPPFSLKAFLSNFYADSTGTSMSMSISIPVRFGPWGGNSGTIFDDGIYTGVRQINLTRGLVGISSMKVLYDRNGQAVWGDKRGVSGGSTRAQKVVFDFPSEILTHITGYFGSTTATMKMKMGPTVIRSLTFHTTRKSHGPFGGDEQHGTFFSSCLADGRIVGFHGRAGWYIDSVGVHVLEGKVLSQQRDDETRCSLALAAREREAGDEVAPATTTTTYGVVKEPVPIGPGPWGGDGGKPWDDGVYTGVRQMYITRTDDFIGSVQMEYDRSGKSVWSTKHGNGGQQQITITHRIKLDYPHEVLTCVYGYYNACVEEGPRVLRSLTLVSSRGRYGPFGDEVGAYFTSATTEGKVVGFHGRCGLYLDAIGVHMQHWLGVGDARTARASAPSKYYISRPGHIDWGLRCSVLYRSKTQVAGRSGVVDLADFEKSKSTTQLFA